MSSHPDHDYNTLVNELIQSGYVTIPQMQQALIESRKSDRSLVEILTSITGRALPPEILSQHHKQYLFTLKLVHGVEYVDSAKEIDLEKVVKIIEKLGILELCYRHRLLPFKLLNQHPPVLKVAMVDPSHTEMLDELKQRLERKGVKLQRLGIIKEDYEQLSQEIYPKLNGSEQIITKLKQAAQPTIVDVTEVFEEMPPHFHSFDEEDGLEELDSDQSDLAPVIKLVNKILLKALENKASAIHLTPQTTSLTVQLRQDGVLESAFDPLPSQLAPAVISRLKVMANLDITQKLLPQKGRISRKFASRSVDFLLNTLPSQQGEKAIIKIIDSRTATLPFNQLFPNSTGEATLQTLLKRSSGLLIVTGTEISGKSATLSSLLTQKNNTGLSVVTVEDPIECTLPHVTQVEVNDQKERTYGKVLQSLLRQDVDVILVDRLENEEIAHYLADAAARGRYVMTSLIAPTISDVIAKLQQLGITPSLLSDTLIGVINQRLVRRLCPTCRLYYTPEPSQLAKFGLNKANSSKINFYKANTLTQTAVEEARGKGRLCRTCDGKGYRGQTGICEVFEVTPSLKALIAQNAPSERLLALAIQEGMQPILSHALTLVQQGDTTLEEIEQVLGENLLVSASSSQKITQSFRASVMDRINAIEQLLASLNQEVELLKQSLSESDDLSVSTPDPFIEETSTLSPSLDEDVNFYEKTIAYEETIASPDALYEELNDPGDWDSLKRELDPSKETMAMSFDEDDEDEDNPHFNPFQSVPDPWS